MKTQSRIGTGSVVLDRILDGGLPEHHTVLLTGTPGTGKSTLAMQILQKGLDEGERCVYISTEQTTDELEDSFAPFEFDLDHENLSVTSIHASPGRTVESDEQELTLQALDPDEEIPGESFGVPFTAERIHGYLEAYAPVDRVVLDSVSGLEVFAEDQSRIRRNILDMIQFFNDDLEATAVFTAESSTAVATGNEVESVEVDDAIQYSVHGVIRLWRELIEGDYRRFLDVMKMRGVDHDTRRFEVIFDSQGIDISPRLRRQPTDLLDHRTTPTGIEGFDDFAGGGLLTDSGVLLEHDGRANVDTLLAQMFYRSLDEGRSFILVPSSGLDYRKLSAVLKSGGWDFDDLLDEGRMFVLDAIGAWELSHENIFNVQNEDAGIEYLLQMVDERSTGTGYFSIFNTEAKVHALGEKKVRQFRYWHESQFFGEDDVLIDVHNPNLMPENLAEFFVDAAGQVFRTWMEDSGIQYVTLDKSPTGDVGGTRLVEYVSEPPYVRIR